MLLDSTPQFVCPLVGWLVDRSVSPSHFTFLDFSGLWPHRSCPSDLVTGATGVAVYPALCSLQNVIGNQRTFLHFAVCVDELSVT